MEPPSNGVTAAAAAAAAARYQENLIYMQIIQFLGHQIESVIVSNERDIAARSKLSNIL
jgi:hypothetical protein